MAKAYSLDLRERVLAAVVEGMPLAEAAKRFGVSVPSIVRWRRLARERGDARAKPFAGGRRARTEEARSAILALLGENPDLSTEALRAALAARGLVFSYGALYRFRQRYRALPGTAPVEEPLEAARETIFALLRGNSGLSIRALLAALAKRGHILGYGALYGFLTRHGFKGKQAGRASKPAAEGETADPKAFADDLRQRILAAVEAGMPYAEAGRLFRVNPATIARWRGQPRQPVGK